MEVLLQLKQQLINAVSGQNAQVDQGRGKVEAWMDVIKFIDSQLNPQPVEEGNEEGAAEGSAPTDQSASN